MKSFLFWQRWLFVVGIVIIISGLLLVFLSKTILFDLLNHSINPVFWDSKVVESNAIEFQKFLYGVLGATMAGWGVFLSFIVFYPFKNYEKWSWYCVVIGLLTWFILDTSISYYYGVYINVIVNMVFLIMTLLPIVFTRKSFINKRMAA